MDGATPRVGQNMNTGYPGNLRGTLRGGLDRGRGGNTAAARDRGGNTTTAVGLELGFDRLGTPPPPRGGSTTQNSSGVMCRINAKLAFHFSGSVKPLVKISAACLSVSM